MFKRDTAGRGARWIAACFALLFVAACAQTKPDGLSSNVKPGTIDNELSSVIKNLQALSGMYYGNPAKGEIGEKGRPTVGERMFAIYRGIERATYGPTPQHKEQLQIVKKEVNSTEAKLRTAQQQLDNIYSKLQAAGAPYVEN